jgi:hypothetical protein
MQALNVGFSVESRLLAQAKTARKLKAAQVASEAAKPNHLISTSSFRASPDSA